MVPRYLSRPARLRRDAARAAQREHLRLGTSMQARVDIFRIIEGAGIWLMFQPLRELFGSYQRREDAAGIIISSNHPSSLQRFTAAHEYGHHVLGHEGSLDLERQIERWTGDLRPHEITAQAFASEFLMPLELVNRALRRIGLSIRPSELSAQDVYRLSVELGVSYSACINQLVALNKLSVGAARPLRRQRPIEIKETLGGKRPENPRADIWLLDETQAGRELAIRVDDEVHVFLEEIPSSGYRWRLEEPGNGDGSGFQLVRESFEQQGSDGRYGMQGRHQFVIRALEPGAYSLRLVKRQPWRPADGTELSFEATLRTANLPTGDMDQGLVQEQKPLLVAV